MSKDTKQIRAIKKFAQEKSIPVSVGQPEQLNENNYSKLLLEDLGFVIAKTDGGLFQCSKFPAGWKKIYDKTMLDWLYLYDNLNRKRAAIFYKFAGYLYENKKKVFTQYITHINWMTRFRIAVNHTEPFIAKAKDNSKHYNSPMVGKIIDENLLEPNLFYISEEIPLITKKGDENYDTEIKELRSKLYYECEEFLKSRYPKWDIVSAYWND